MKTLFLQSNCTEKQARHTIEYRELTLIKEPNGYSLRQELSAGNWLCPYCHMKVCKSPRNHPHTPYSNSPHPQIWLNESSVCRKPGKFSKQDNGKLSHKDMKSVVLNKRNTQTFVKEGLGTINPAWVEGIWNRWPLRFHPALWLSTRNK